MPLAPDCMAVKHPLPHEVSCALHTHELHLNHTNSKAAHHVWVCAHLQVRLPRKYAIRLPKPGADSKEGFCNDAYASILWENGGVKGYDLVMFVTANQTRDCKQGALAYTLPCLTDMVTGRPTAAGMNVCPLSQRSSPHRLLNTLVHEMVHALVSIGAVGCGRGVGVRGTCMVGQAHWLHCRCAIVHASDGQ